MITIIFSTNDDESKVDNNSTIKATHVDNQGPPNSHLDTKVKATESNSTKAITSNNTNNNKKSKTRKRSIPADLKLGQNLTPPPPTTSTSSLHIPTSIHSAETPATISKLKRKRCRTTVRINKTLQCENGSNSSNRNGSGSQKPWDGEKKLKISASQEVDRVFDCLGLPDEDTTKPSSSLSSTRSGDNTMGESCPPSASPLGSNRLLFNASNSTVLTTTDTLQSRTNKLQPGIKGRRQKLKLPPLRPDKENIITSKKEQEAEEKEEEDVQDLFKEIEMGLDRFRDGRDASDSGYKCENVPHTSSGGKRSAVPMVASGLSNHSFTTENPMRGVPGALKPSTGVQVNSNGLNNRSFFDVTKTSTVGFKPNYVSPRQGARKEMPGTTSATSVNLPPRPVHTSNLKQPAASTGTKPSSKAATKLPAPLAAATNAVTTSNAHTNRTNLPKSNSAKPCPMPSKNNDDEFADDGWNEEDFAAIDQCIAMSQCKVIEKPVKNDEFDDGLDDDLAALDVLPAAQKPWNNAVSEPSITIDDEFGDDDDDEFAALDLSATSIPPSHAPATSTATAPKSALLNSFESNFGGTTNNTATVSNVPSSNTSEFSDDNFDDMDFDAIDSKIAQHQMQQASQPSRHVPSHNRRNPDSNNTLCFTRYVIRSVDQNFSTNTKTIGVSLWSLDEVKSKSNDELECLRQYQENEAICKVNAMPSVHGYIHLRGIWYYTKCHPGDVIHLISISGQYATDTAALPVVLDSSNNGDDDDLVLVIHPDELITPTLISEAVQCPRLAVLQQRLGSTGLSSRSAVIGTLRHDLFERCLQERTASRQAAAVFIRQIIRNNAESLVGCGITDQRDAFSEVMKTLPQIQVRFHSYQFLSISCL